MVSNGLRCQEAYSNLYNHSLQLQQTEKRLSMHKISHLVVDRLQQQKTAEHNLTQTGQLKKKKITQSFTKLSRLAESVPMILSSAVTALYKIHLTNPHSFLAQSYCQLHRVATALRVKKTRNTTYANKGLQGQKSHRQLIAGWSAWASFNILVLQQIN